MAAGLAFPIHLSTPVYGDQVARLKLFHLFTTQVVAVYREMVEHLVEEALCSHDNLRQRLNKTIALKYSYI